MADLYYLDYVTFLEKLSSSSVQEHSRLEIQISGKYLSP